MAEGSSTRKRLTVPGRPSLADRLVDPFQRFGQLQAGGGVLLLVMAAVAMVWANSPWAESYHHLWHEVKVAVKIGAGDMAMSLGHWINDLLMGLFFLLVGLEIKREVRDGELSSPRKAALPVAAALGGMIVPAGIYAAMHWGQPTIRGWGVPMATDIAFALGVLALLGKRIPVSLRLFLTTLAIADDLGALLVIAIFYTENLDLNSLGIAGLIMVVLVAMGVAGFRSLMLYMLVGAVLWYFVFHSGIHATIAGVALAMAIPARPRVDARKFAAFTREALDEFEQGGTGGDTPRGRLRRTTVDQQELVHAIESAGAEAGSPLHRLEHTLFPWVGFLIVPLFALANSGVHIGSGASQAGAEGVGGEMRVGLGVALGLMLGKPIGVLLFAWLAVKAGLAVLPSGVRWGHIHGVSWLAGIGFTMALFIANLAFAGQPALLDGAKLGILGGSLVAGVVGLVVLLVATRPGGGGASVASDAGARPADDGG